MSTKKTNGSNGTRKVKTIALKAHPAYTHARHGTKAGTLQEVLDGKGASMTRICKELSEVGASVSPAVARSWMRYLNDTHGLGVSTHKNKKTGAVTFHLVKGRLAQVTV